MPKILKDIIKDVLKDTEFKYKLKINGVKK